ncbi:MAG: hypothetical protein K2J24_04520, partial [Muribaculaceae bacterium]|nr:hypothetical protein [Muribaculaceae bacterium]
YWTLAQAKAGNEQGVLEGIGSIYRPAALFATNKENLNLDNGDIFTELNSSNMLWSLSGNLALTQQILFGIHFEPDGLRIAPFVPEVLGGERTLENFPYRGARLNITVSGYGDSVASITLNGKKLKPGTVIPASQLKGNCDIRVVMDNEPIPSMSLARTPNVKAPLTPITWLSHDPELAAAGVPVENRLQWNPIEYIAGYIVLRDGEEVGRTRQTTWAAIEPGEWQVIGIDGNGVQSFASEPRSNRQRLVAEMPGEGIALRSSEISYRPDIPVEGFSGKGFVEVDHNSAPVNIAVDIPADGIYTFSLRYANGNGPVNTENKAAIRTVTVDGNKVGTVVMPTRGVANWNDWGQSNTVRVPMKAGKHTVTVEYLPEDENMNLTTNHALLDRLVIERAR